MYIKKICLNEIFLVLHTFYWITFFWNFGTFLLQVFNYKTGINYLLYNDGSDLIKIKSIKSTFVCYKQNFIMLTVTAFVKITRNLKFTNFPMDIKPVQYLYGRTPPQTIRSSGCRAFRSIVEKYLIAFPSSYLVKKRFSVLTNILKKQRP